MDEEKRDCRITAKDIEDAVKRLEKNALQNRDKHTYFFPSPHNGKRLQITGNIYPYTAAVMAFKVWTGEKTVEDFPEMTEIDIEKEGVKWVN